MADMAVLSIAMYANTNRNEPFPSDEINGAKKPPTMDIRASSGRSNFSEIRIMASVRETSEMNVAVAENKL